MNMNEKKKKRSHQQPRHRWKKWQRLQRMAASVRPFAHISCVDAKKDRDTVCRATNGKCGRGRERTEGGGGVEKKMKSKRAQFYAEKIKPILRIGWNDTQ